MPFLCARPLSPALRYTGDFERAEALYHEALILFRGISEDLPAIQNVLIHLAYLSYETTRYDLARSLATESLELARKGNRPHAAASAMVVLGNVSSGEGRLDEAEEWYRQAMDIFASVGSRINIALGKANLADVSRSR